MRRAQEVIIHQTKPLSPNGGCSLSEPIDDLAPVHWINPATERYYAARLVLNLFGQWELQQAWGSLKSRRGRLRYLPLASRAEGRQLLVALARRRTQRGYKTQPIGTQPIASSASHAAGAA